MNTGEKGSEILTEHVDHICRIQINRLEKKNALTRPMYAAIADAVRRADADAGIRVIFLQGTSGCFCAGNDLKDFRDYSESGKGRPSEGNPFLSAISEASKPMIAAVTGPAVGVGTTMLLHFDLVYAGAGARFSMPFVNLGLCPEAASSFLLPRLIGHHRASELLLLGEAFSADEAREMGIVNKVYTDQEVIEKAFGHARKLAGKPPASVRLTKALLKKRSSDHVRSTMAEELKHFNQRLVSGECKEALAAFFERREPDFSSFE